MAEATKPKVPTTTPADPNKPVKTDTGEPEPLPLVTDLRTGTEVAPEVVAHYAAYLQGTPYDTPYEDIPPVDQPPAEPPPTGKKEEPPK